MKKALLRFTGAMFALVATSALLAGSSPAAVSYSTIYSFTGGNDGGDPASDLIFDGSGNAYGTTVSGGAFGYGTVFKLSQVSPGAWASQTLWNFSGGGDGKAPHGGLAFDAHGNLVGTTVAGGTGGICTGDGCGEVFSLSHVGITILYGFRGGNDGWGPGSAVVIDRNGNIFGETPDGGSHQAGTIYKLTISGGHVTHTVIHAFTGGRDGAVGSLGPLLLDASGNLFGVTELGGTHQAGTVFELSPTAAGTWSFRSLYEFKGMPDAGYPYGGLTADARGDLFGTTYYGGANGLGSAYELSPTARGTYRERVLYSFAGGTDGSYPTTTLRLGRSNDLYGTTSTGGRPSCDCGTLFKLEANTFAEKVLHRFGAGTDGSYPYYGFALDHNGNLFSTTNFGGLYGQGTVFELLR